MIWTAESYRMYLRSGHWAVVRQETLRAADFRCARCGRGRSVVLDVHHRTYERIGAEQPGDLEVLCRPCHGAEHGIEPAPPPRAAWNWESVAAILPRTLARLGLTFTAKVS